MSPTRITANLKRRWDCSRDIFSTAKCSKCSLLRVESAGSVNINTLFPAGFSSVATHFPTSGSGHSKASMSVRAQPVTITHRREAEVVCCLQMFCIDSFSSSSSSSSLLMLSLFSLPTRIPYSLVSTNRTIFKAFGTVVRCTVVRHPDGSSKGYGFIEYVEYTEAESALAALHNKDIEGSRLTIEFSRQPSGMRGRMGVGRGRTTTTTTRQQHRLKMTETRLRS